MSNHTVQISGAKREHAIVLTAVIGIVVILWIVLAIIVENMRGPTAAKMEMQMMEIKPWTAVDFLLIFLMWAVMMTGMMVPSATPAILNFAALSREHQRQGRTYVPTAVFVLGYVVVWIAFSIVFTLLQWGLNSLALLSPMMVLTSPVVGGLVLIAAGIYQWSPIHKNLLSRCRNPLGILSRRFGEGATAFFMGLENGAYCLGCCLVLMLILFVAGVMNLLWAALIAFFVLVVKALPYGDEISRWSAIPLVLAGIVVLIV
jgi:predicted metal-binding membrane protein